MGREDTGEKLRHIFDGHFLDGNGKVIESATIQVYLADTTTAVTIYAAKSGGSAITTGKVETDSSGYFVFYIDDSTHDPDTLFDVVMSKTNFSSRTIPDLNIIKRLVGVLTVDTTSTGNVGSGEDTLISYPMPADVLDADGKGVEITAWGTTAANGNNKTIKLHFGATELVTSAAIAINDKDWKITATVLRTGTATQEAEATYHNETPTTVGPVRTAPTDDETAVIVIKVTGDATATDDIVQKSLVVKKLP